MIAPARLAAFEILRAVDRGADLGSALARHRTGLKDERDRALAGEIATGTLRWRLACDHLISAFSNRPLARMDAEVVDVLRLTIFQLLHLDRIPASAAVKDAVDLAGRAGKRSAAGLVNAVARRVSRERDRLPFPPPPDNSSDRSAAIQYLSITWSHPEWLVSRWLDRYGFEAAESWAKFNNAPAPLALRVNRLKTDIAQATAALTHSGVTAEPATHVADALVVREGNPLGTAVYERGEVFVQDEASQLVGAYADARPNERVLDACASPGGKTLMMASAMNDQGFIAAMDVRPRRVRLLRETIGRSGSQIVRIVQADASAPLPFRGTFDRVLLDAPCSGLGTVRRDPDIKWKRRERDLAGLAAAQQAMLDSLAQVVRAGGRLIYSTCSSEPEENEQVVEGFLSRHPDFSLAGDPLRTTPFQDRLEAFFAAMLVRDKDLR